MAILQNRMTALAIFASDGGWLSVAPKNRLPFFPTPTRQNLATIRGTTSRIRFESGPQACLIETKNEAGLLEIVDALTIVPVNVSAWHSSVEDPLYGCWLGVIADVYKKDIVALRKMWTFDPLATQDERQPPFRPERHGNLVEFAQKLLDEWSPVDTSTPDIFNHSTWLGFKDTLREAYCWYTRHVKMHEASKLCVEQWRILSMWESWEQPIKKKTYGQIGG